MGEKAMPCVEHALFINQELSVFAVLWLYSIGKEERDFVALGFGCGALFVEQIKCIGYSASSEPLSFFLLVV